MSHMVDPSRPASQATSVDRGDSTKATDVAHRDITKATDVALAIALARLRLIVDTRYGKLEALALAMGKKPHYKSYISQVLNGERPMPLSFILRLPADVKADFFSASAEDLGRMVVPQIPTGPEAAKQFFAGLFGLLQAQSIALASLPHRAGEPLKAALDARDPGARRTA